MKEEVEEQEIQKVEKIISFEIFVFVLNLFEFSRTKIFLFKKPKDGDFKLISPVPYSIIFNPDSSAICLLRSYKGKVSRGNGDILCSFYLTERMTHVNSIHNTRKAHL